MCANKLFKKLMFSKMRVQTGCCFVSAGLSLLLRKHIYCSSSVSAACPQGERHQAYSRSSKPWKASEMTASFAVLRYCITISSD